MLCVERARDKRVRADGELSDSEDEGEGGRRNVKSRRISADKDAPTAAAAGPSKNAPVPAVQSAPVGSATATAPSALGETAATSTTGEAPAQGVSFNKFGNPQLPTHVVDEDIEMTDAHAATTAQVAASGTVKDGPLQSSNSISTVSDSTATAPPAS